MSKRPSNDNFYRAYFRTSAALQKQTSAALDCLANNSGQSRRRTQTTELSLTRNLRGSCRLHVLVKCTMWIDSFGAIPPLPLYCWDEVAFFCPWPYSPSQSVFSEASLSPNDNMAKLARFMRFSVNSHHPLTTWSI